MAKSNELNRSNEVTDIQHLSKKFHQGLPPFPLGILPPSVPRPPYPFSNSPLLGVRNLPDFFGHFKLTCILPDASQNNKIITNIIILRTWPNIYMIIFQKLTFFQRLLKPSSCTVKAYLID